MNRTRRRLRLAPPPTPTIEAPELADLANELLDRRLQEVTIPSPLGAYGLRRCADELASHARTDALTVIYPEGWAGWGLAIVPRSTP